MEQDWRDCSDLMTIASSLESDPGFRPSGREYLQYDSDDGRVDESESVEVETSVVDELTSTDQITTTNDNETVQKKACGGEIWLCIV